MAQVAVLNFECWLNKVVEWGQTTTLESQQDVCLHLPKLQECLLQIYETLKHMKPGAAIQSFPAIGQLLGRLCWNPFVVSHEETRKALMCCLCCLHSSEPQNAVEVKANNWIQKIVLSELAVLNLWLRHLPSLEKAALDLFQRLIAIQSKSLREMEHMIQDSLLVSDAVSQP
ncbi:hypothetical protein FKM82_000669 [Ascaphus truei]